MHGIQIETKVLQIVDQTREGKPVEDAIVELKADWPADIPKAARRLAGHANASSGQEILWLIGIDEGSSKVTGATRTELANWLPQVESRFDGAAPNLVKDLVVSTGSGESVVALAFETDQAPYVVKHPKNPDILEVPWRQGTRVRSAQRTELIRLLLPAIDLPQFEVLSAKAEVCNKRNSCMTVTLDLYNTTRPNDWIVIPFHAWSASLGAAGEVRQIDIDRSKITPQSDTITKSGNELVIGGPGALRVMFHMIADLDKIADEQLVITLTLPPVGAASPVVIQEKLKLSAIEENGERNC